MKIKYLNKFGAVGLTAIFCLGCSLADSAKKTPGESIKNDVPAASNETATTVKTAASPCANRFYPVKNGIRRDYKNTVGGDTSLTMEYTDGAAQFIEVTSLKDVSVRHVWNCTDEGLIAANYGSAAQMSQTKMIPKHVSGVTLPKESDIQIGKTWQTVYTAVGTSELGAVDVKVTLNNKVVRLDDTVKTPGGTFKAVKVEIDIDSDMKFGGKKMPVPVIKSAAWFAPDVGMVKNSGSFGGVSNSMEYAGGN